MDGRDFGPPRSVHGPPPPLLSGLAMDSHRVGAATAGRLPASGLPGPLPPGKYMAGLNLHPHPGEAFLGSFVASGMGPSASSHGSPVPLPSDLSFRSPTPSNLPMVQLWATHAHEGFSHLPSGLYPSYLHLNHLEPPSSGSPLLSQLGQPSIFDTQKDGFYLPAPGAPGALHAQAPSSRTPGSHSGAPAKGPAKERAGRSGEPPPLFSKKDQRAREEATGPRGVVDLTQEARAEGRQDRGHPRLAERLSPFLAEPGPPRAPGVATADSKGKNSAPPSVLSLCNGVGEAGLPTLMAEAARGAKEAARQDESARLRRTEALLAGPCPCPSPLPPLPPGKGPPAPSATATTSAGAFASQPGPAGVYTIFPAAAPARRT